MRGAIEAAIEIVRPALDAKRLQLVVEYEPGAGIIAGDPERLQQVFWNLVSNAVKFTPEGGQVKVAVARAGSHTIVAVSDTGRGIAPRCCRSSSSHSSRVKVTRDEKMAWVWVYPSHVTWWSSTGGRSRCTVTASAAACSVPCSCPLPLSCGDRRSGGDNTAITRMFTADDQQHRRTPVTGEQ